MKRRIIALAVSALMAVTSIASVAADQPPGLRGYEGQPGHQAGQKHQGPASGLLGYEGQPGNQGG